MLPFNVNLNRIDVIIHVEQAWKTKVAGDKLVTHNEISQLSMDTTTTNKQASCDFPNLPHTQAHLLIVSVFLTVPYSFK
jgi:hypothetical protein